ncbi:MAG: hypothetical protein V2G42_00350 [bacterium JZ-2024 1]
MVITSWLRGAVPPGCSRNRYPSLAARFVCKALPALIIFALGANGGFIGIDKSPAEVSLAGFLRPLALKDYVLYEGKSISEVVFLTTGVRISAAWRGEVRAAVVDRETRKEVPYFWLEVGYKGKMVTFLGEEERQEFVQILVPEEIANRGVAAIISDEGFRPAALRVQEGNRTPQTLSPEQWEWALEQYPALMVVGGLSRKSLTYKGSSEQSTDIGTLPSKSYDFKRTNVYRFGSGRTEYEWTADGQVDASDNIPFGPIRITLDLTYLLRRALPGTGADGHPEFEPIRKIRVSGEWRIKKVGTDAQAWMAPPNPKR